MAFKNLHCILHQYYWTSTITSARTYGRWMHRKPAKVLLNFEDNLNSNLKKETVINLESKFINVKTKVEQSPVHGKPNDTDINKEKSLQKHQKVKEKLDLKIEKRKLYLSQNKVFDDNNEFIYVKLNSNNGKISSLIVNLKSKKERTRSGQILVEGWRLIVDGLEAKCPLNYLMFSQTDDLNKLRPFLPKTGVKIYKVPYKDLQLWSTVETSPGILGIFEIPKIENVKRMSKPLPITFICDNIRDPGNLGAILRAAVGVGCEKVLLTKGCVDVWDPKVIRSAAGAHFRLPVQHSIGWEDMPSFLEDDTSVFIADSNTNHLDEENEIIQEKLLGIKLPVLPYYSVEFATFSNITLILGGETEGISEDSYRFTASKNGLRLNIPLQKGVDSLNTGMATAVIAFEIRKHLLRKTCANTKQELQAVQAN